MHGLHGYLHVLMHFRYWLAWLVACAHAYSPYLLLGFASHSDLRMLLSLPPPRKEPLSPRVSEGNRWWIIAVSSPVSLSSFVVAADSSCMFSSSSASRINNCGFVHLWPAVNLSLQLKHKPWALRLCISSQESFLIGPVGEAQLLKICGGGERLKCGDLTSLFCRCNCSSLILAKLIASLRVLGLNSRISSDISGFSPPMNVPTRAFWVHPWTRLPSLSNSF